jgi:hypothetical protein
MRWLIVVSLVGACVPAETVRVKRWPTHRQDRDARIEKLEHDLEVVTEHVAKLEAEIAAAHAQPAVPSSPSATP